MTRTASVGRPSARAAGRSSPFPSVGVLIGGIMLVVVLLATVVLIPSPHFVHRITLANPSPYDLDVDVRSGSGDGWLALGTAERNGRTDINEVYDIGEAWVFRYATQGVVSGTFHVTRAELRKHDWQVRVPDVVGIELRAQEVPAQP